MTIKEFGVAYPRTHVNLARSMKKKDALYRTDLLPHDMNAAKETSTKRA